MLVAFLPRSGHIPTSTESLRSLVPFQSSFLRCCLSHLHVWRALRVRLGLTQQRTGSPAHRCAFLLDGFFIAGARTFGPTEVLDVEGIGPLWNTYYSYFWIDGHSIEAKLPGKISYDEWEKLRSWSENLELTNDLDSKPGRVQISMWDRQVYWITMKDWNPPTIGEPPHANIRAFLELLVGLVLVVLSAIIWREGRRRGIRCHKYDPFMFLAEQSRRS